MRVVSGGTAGKRESGFVLCPGPMGLCDSVPGGERPVGSARPFRSIQSLRPNGENLRGGGLVSPAGLQHLIGVMAFLSSQEFLQGRP